jgi:transporter family protein
MNASSIVTVLIVATLYGAYNFSIKAGSDGIHQIVGAVVLQIVAALIGIASLLYLSCSEGIRFQITPKGLSFSVLAGIAVGIAEILSFYVFSKGVPATVAIPIIVGGTALTGTIFGILFLGETLSWNQGAGVILMIVAIVLVLVK